MTQPDPAKERQILLETKYLRVCCRDGWYYVERPGVTGIVGIIALTEAGELLLVEQYRIPVSARCIELPAGLADVPDEPLAETARRELLEETGFRAERIELLVEGVHSPGAVNHTMCLYLAEGLTREHDGGGVDGEDITVHRVPLADVPAFLGRMARQGLHVDLKIYAALQLIAGR